MSVSPSQPANRPSPPKRATTSGAGPQHQVVRVAQHDLHAEALIVVGAEVLDGARPRRHEARRRVQAARRRRHAGRAAPSTALGMNVTGCTARTVTSAVRVPQKFRCHNGSVRIRSILTIAVLAALTAPSAAAAAPPTAVPRCDRARGRSRSSTRRRVSTCACSSAERGDRRGRRRSRRVVVVPRIEPGNYTVEIEDAGAVATTDVAVPGFDDPPPQAFYDDQQIGAGFGYVTVRDGTSLSVNVVLPGDIDDGPFPTVVEYSGYDPSDPAGSGVGLSALMTALGYAWVGVNMRGSGCSGAVVRLLRTDPGHRRVRRDRDDRLQPWSRRQRRRDGGHLVLRHQPAIRRRATTAEPARDHAAQRRRLVGPVHALSRRHPQRRLRSRMGAPTMPDGAVRPGVDREDRIADGDETCRANQLLRLQTPSSRSRSVTTRSTRQSPRRATSVR